MRFRKCSSCVFPPARPTRNRDPANFLVHQTSSQLRALGQLSTSKNDESSHDHAALPGQPVTTLPRRPTLRYQDEILCLCVAICRDSFSLSHSRSARQCLMIRTDTTLDQDEGLKATAKVCTACTVVSLSTASLNFITPPLTWTAPFDA